MHESKQLIELQEALLFSPTRPQEELYDWQADPHQVKNLATVAEYQGTLREMRGKLDQWIRETGDLGQVPETETRYDSDMASYLGRGNPEVEKNIALMKRWRQEGK